MNDLYLESYTVSELIEYFRNTSTDRALLKVLNYIELKPETLVAELVAEGMDPEDFTFDNTYSAGEYIRSLNNEVSYLNDEIHRLEKEVSNLKARTIIDILVELRDEVEQAKRAEHRTACDLQRANDELAVTKNKLKMWSTLNAAPEKLRGA